jgi:hypothetical protein
VLDCFPNADSLGAHEIREQHPHRHFPFQPVAALERHLARARAHTHTHVR